MTFLQIVLAESAGMSSGAELRNLANFDSVSAHIEGAVFALQPAQSGTIARVTPIVQPLALGEIDRLLDEIRKRQPAFALVEGVALVDAAIALKKAFPTLPLIADCHNVESALLMDMQQARVPLALRAFAPLLYRSRNRAAVRAERSFLSLSDSIWVTSTPDAKVIKSQFGLSNTQVIANPVPAWCKTERLSHVPDENRVLFVGHLGYSPNKRAVAELCSAIIPALRAVCPTATLHVCGRRPGARLRRRVQRANGELIANPPDLSDIYASASVTAMPIREGGGTRIKAIESLAVGCPIVATAKAVEGLGLVPGRHYLAAESASDFVAELARVLASQVLRQDLAASGKELAEDRFGSTRRDRDVGLALKRMGVAGGDLGGST